MPRPASIQKKKRLTLELAEPVHKRLATLRVQTGAESVTEVIRRALALYSTIVDAGETRLVVRGKDGKERSMLIPSAIV